MIQRMLAIWSLFPLPFLKPAWTSETSLFTYCWSLAWRILSITLLACEMSAIMRYFEHSLALPFLGIGMKTDLFHSCGHCWVFQICWYIECSTFTASSFRIWNSSTGISSPPLALFVVMLPKAPLTSHSRMSAYSIRACFHVYRQLSFYCFHIAMKVRELFKVSFIRSLIPFMSTQPYWPNHLCSNAIMLEARISICEFGGET